MMKCSPVTGIYMQSYSSTLCTHKLFVRPNKLVMIHVRSCVYVGVLEYQNICYKIQTIIINNTNIN